jgi:hypothetical protein
VNHINNHSSQNEHTRVLVNLVFALIKGQFGRSPSPLMEQLLWLS